MTKFDDSSVLGRVITRKWRTRQQNSAIVRNTPRQAESRAKRLRRERGTLRRKLAALEADLGRLATAELPSDVRMRRLAEVQDQSRETQLARLETEQISDEEITSALADFDGVWDALQPREQSRAIELLVESVTWDGEGQSISVTFRPTGINTPGSEGGSGMSDLTVTKKVHFQRGRRSRKAMREGAKPESSAGSRAARLMALVIRFDQLIRDGGVADEAELARLPEECGEGSGSRLFGVRDRRPKWQDGRVSNYSADTVAGVADREFGSWFRSAIVR